MTAAAPISPRAAPHAAIQPVHHGRLSTAVRDSFTVAWRNFTGLRRTPQFIVFSLIQPVIFVLMFRYVFGGAIQPVLAQTGFPYSYVDYLMPGVFAQTVVFGSVGTAVGLATDLQTGIIERFRALPMARSAVLTGRTTTDLFRNLVVLLLMIAVGVLVGFRIHSTSPWHTIGAFALLLLFGYSMSWVFGTVGLLVKDPETAQAAVFPILAPLVFASTAFVPASTMPAWLQVWAEHQPVSVTIDAVRDLLNGLPATSATLASLAWSIGLIAVAAPLSVRRYRKAV